MSAQDLAKVKPDDLTEVAKQCYRDELERRGASLPKSPSITSDKVKTPAISEHFARFCYFCKKNAPDEADAVVILLHKIVRHSQAFNVIKTEYLTNSILVPRCPECCRLHGRVRWIRAIGGFSVCYVLMVACFHSWIDPRTAYSVGEYWERVLGISAVASLPIAPIVSYILMEPFLTLIQSSSHVKPVRDVLRFPPLKELTSSKWIPHEYVSGFGGMLWLCKSLVLGRYK
jgi:hypothetical protein